jgi:hypothetical protein
MEFMRMSAIQVAPLGRISFWAALANVFSGAVNYGFGDYLGPVEPIAESKLGNQFRESLEGRIDSRQAAKSVG